MARLIVLVLSIALLVGCGGGGSSSTPTSSAVPTPTPSTPQNLVVTPGNWDFTITGQLGAGFAGGNLTQTGSTLAGIFHIANGACVALTDDAAFTGTTNPTGATINMPPVATQGAITATLTGSASSLNGNYTGTGGCTGSGSGALAGVSVPALNGSWTGLLQSISGPLSSVSATLTQTAADIHGIAGVTGTAALTNSPCPTTFTIIGSGVAGRIVNIVLQGADGSTATFNGQLTSPATAKQISGTYQIAGGLCTGDSGTGVISRP